MTGAARALPVSFAAALVVVGCGGAGQGGGDAGLPGSGTTNLDQYVAVMTSIVCGGEAAACCAPVGARADVATCRTNLSYSARALKERVATSSSVEPLFNPAEAAACLDLLRAVVASCARFIPNDMKPPCGAILSPGLDGGTVGTPCHLAADCAQPTSGTAWCDFGFCALHADAREGEACHDDGDCRPAGTLVCDHDTQTCLPRVGPGGACSDSWTCADRGGGCLAHQCIEPGALDEACETAGSGQRSCQRDLVCTGGTCAAGLPAGSLCASTPDACEDGSLCVLVNAAKGKQCVWQPLLGICTML